MSIIDYAILAQVKKMGNGGGGEVSAMIKPLTITKNGTYNAVAGGELKYDTAVKFKQTITDEEFEAYIANATPTTEEDGFTAYVLFGGWEFGKEDYGDGTVSYMLMNMRGGPADPAYSSIFGGWVTPIDQAPAEAPFTSIPSGSEMSADLATTAIFFDLSRIDGYAPIVVDACEIAALIDPLQNNNVDIYSESVNAVGDYAFYEMNGVFTVDLPNATSVGVSAFYCCHAYSVKLPKVRTFAKGDANSYETFRSSNLKQIYLRDVESIRSKLFDQAYVKTVVLASETVVPLENVDAFSSTSSLHIYVPKTLVESYKTTKNWSTYANLFRAIEDYPEECEF